MWRKGVVWAAMTVYAVVGVGCTAKPTMVQVNAPAGSVLELGEKKYTLPAMVAFDRPDKPGEMRRSDIAFTFPIKGQSVKAEGVLQTYGYAETDVDRLATNTWQIGDAELAKLLDGYAVIFDGFSASKQAIYKVTIGKKK